MMANEDAVENSDDYGITLENESAHWTAENPFGDILDAEPADPPQIDHQRRRLTRIAPSDIDCGNFPDPFLECGCGECSAQADPLADSKHAFRDVVQAADTCPEPRPLKVHRAGTAYYAYQKALLDRFDRTSRIEAIRDTYGKAMEAERQLLNEWDDDVTTALLSFRLSPIRDNYGLTLENSSNAERQWIPPTELVERLRHPWAQIYDTIYNRLKPFEREYLWIVGTTDSAATPHLHLYLWIRDPEDEITAEYLKPSVGKFVTNAQGAEEKHHPVENGESDAIVVQHEPDILGISDEQVWEIHEKTDVEGGFRPNTAGFGYLMTQRPDWALARIENGESTIEEERMDLEGAAILWASSRDSLGSSSGMDLQSGKFKP